jgi:hypothetical protein
MYPPIPLNYCTIKFALICKKKIIKKLPSFRTNDIVNIFDTMKKYLQITVIEPENQPDAGFLIRDLFPAKELIP